MSRMRKGRDCFELEGTDDALVVEYVRGEFQCTTWGPSPVLAKPHQIEALAAWMRDKEAGK